MVASFTRDAVRDPSQVALTYIVDKCATTKLCFVLGVGIYTRYPCLLSRSKDVETRAQDLHTQGQSSTATVEALRVELEESRRVLSDLQVSDARPNLEAPVPLCGTNLFPRSRAFTSRSKH